MFILGNVEVIANPIEREGHTRLSPTIPGFALVVGASQIFSATIVIDIQPLQRARNQANSAEARIAAYGVMHGLQDGGKPAGMKPVRRSIAPAGLFVLLPV